MQPRPLLVAVFLILIAIPPINAIAQTPPPAPTLISPSNGATLAQPMTLQWSAVSDPDGPIGSYTWQVGTTSSFSVVIASGFTDSRNGDPIPTSARVSGLPNATYFWRVKATQMVGGAVGSIDSPWSQVQTFTVNGLGPAPAGTPSITGPGTGSSFHPYEFFKITWTPIQGAQYFVLEADDEPSFSYPLTLSTSPMEFGVSFDAGWGNEIPNIYYRVRAVSADNVRGLPSNVLNVHIVNSAPVPAPPTPLSPSGGATVSLPFTFDWTDTAHPQIPGYDIDVDDEPTFAGAFGVLMVQNVSRSDYTLVSDLAPGTYYWRVRAIHGNTYGPWSSGVSFRVVASPPTPPGLTLFWMLVQPSSVEGGASTQARVTLNSPAPTGGAQVRIASDMPHAEVPINVTIPAGSTDATVSPITTIPVHGATIGTLRAAYGTSWQQNSLGLFPLLFSLSLNKNAVVGGTTVTGKVTLQRAAPVGGAEVTLVSSDTSMVRVPAKVVVPEGESSASFPVTTSTVVSSTQVTINTGTANDNYRAPETWLTLLPAGAPTPAPALSSVTVATPSVLGGGSTSGTVTLTGPAPAGGATVWVNGSMEGQVITPNGNVTIPAGSTSANFPIQAPQVAAPYWVLVQASYGGEAGMHAAVIRIDPAQPAIPDLYALGLDGVSTIGGGSLHGTVGLATPAPPGGTTVSLSSSDPATAQVPPSIQVGAGNSANSFTISTSASVTGFQSVQITAQSGAGIKSQWISVYPNPNSVVLSSITPSVSGTTGGNSIPATLFLSGNAPAGGAQVTLSSSNTAAAQVPASVTVPGGQGWANFTITTSPVSADTSVTITGNYGATQTATITVMAAAAASNTGLLSPTANAPDSAGDGNGFEVNPGNAMADDSLNAVDTNSGTASSTSCTSTARDKHRFLNYGITLPSGATVKGIEVRLDSRVDDTAGSPRMCVELSWDGGNSWTAPIATSTLSTSMRSRTLGGAANTWGRSWTPAELSNANFRVRITDVANSTSRDFTLDWAAVRISY
ncbi:MAG TPA: hypothetical protein VGJ78_05450 [Vicinamibacterales bacterium]|jgi:hypothetical protein